MARAHFQLGVFYAESGDYVSATNELRETVQLEPGMPKPIIAWRKPIDERSSPSSPIWR
jgi:Tfp pilus assembly protein PilF